MDDKEFNEKILKLFPMLTPGSVVNIPCEVKSFRSVSDADVTGSKLSVTFKPIDMHCDGAYVICKNIDRLCDIIMPSEPEEYNEIDEVLDIRIDDAFFRAGFTQGYATRAVNCLMRGKLRTLKDIIYLTDDELIEKSAKGFGKHSLEITRKVIDYYKKEFNICSTH